MTSAHGSGRVRCRRGNFLQKVWNVLAIFCVSRAMPLDTQNWQQNKLNEMQARYGMLMAGYGRMGTYL